MNVGVTLTSKEFSTLHNLLCKLSNTGDEASELVAAIRDGVLKASYDADIAMFDKLSAHYRAVGKDFQAQTSWSMFEVGCLHSKHGYKGIKTITHKSHWGDTTPVVKVPGDTWMDLYIAADAAIKESGDLHHCYIEDFTQEGDTLLLHTGS